MAALAAAAALCWGPAAAQDAARSSDGRWQLQAAPPASLRLLDEAGRPVRSWTAATLDGRTVSAVASVHDNPARRSFLVAFTTLPELWEISYDPAAEPIFDGLVHDYRMGEGIARSGFLGVRRSPLEAPLAVLALAAQGRVVLAGTTAGEPALEAIHLDVRRRIARIPLAAAPTPAASALFTRAGRELLAVGSAQGLQVVDPSAQRVLATLALGAVASVRSHPDAPHLWVALAPAGGRQAVVLGNKETLQAGAPVERDEAAPAPPAATPQDQRLRGSPGSRAVP